ncbi:MAG: hypothetical protein OES57_00200 [Acidimicrobiia bacterium]|nr:hypothetical protein [Acidimicrobiia bacterium]
MWPSPAVMVRTQWLALSRVTPTIGLLLLVTAPPLSPLGVDNRPVSAIE